MRDRESIRNEVRACIREELNNSQGTQTLVNRTRNLIRESASFAARNLSDSGSVQPLPQNQNSKSKRPLPGHPLRFGSKKSKTATPESIPKSVYLLDEPDVEDDEEYSLTESMIILKGECDLYCDADENGIRSELVNLFKTKLPFITNGDFDFVRRDRNIISSPVVKKEHVWDSKHVKHLCGTGRLYVRLNVSKDTLVEDEEGSITETPAPAPSTSLPSISAEARPSGLHAFSGFGDVAAISQNTTSVAGLSTREFNIRRLRTTARDKHATAHDQTT